MGLARDPAQVWGHPHPLDGVDSLGSVGFHPVALPIESFWLENAFQITESSHYLTLPSLMLNHVHVCLQAAATTGHGYDGDESSLLPQALRSCYPPLLLLLFLTP